MMSLMPPAGCGFAPSEKQLCCYYLAGKNRGPVDPGGSDDYRSYDFIKELNVYEYHPSALPDYTCFSYGYGGRRRHWYFYTKVNDVKKSERRAIGGYWEMRDSDVVNPDWTKKLGELVVFRFYEGNPGTTSSRTNWVLYEYSLPDEAPFKLCRVFYKSQENTASYSGVEKMKKALRMVKLQGSLPLFLIVKTKDDARKLGSDDRSILDDGTRPSLVTETDR